MSNPWVSIIGKGKDGRRGVTIAVVEALRARGVSVGGVLHEPIRDEHGDRVGMHAVCVESGERLTMAYVDEHDPVVCDYAFDDDAFHRVRAWIADGDHQVAVVEVGPLEGRGHGHWPAVTAALAGPPRVVLLGIRPKALMPIAMQLDDPGPSLQLPANEAEIGAFVEAVAALALR